MSVRFIFSEGEVVHAKFDDMAGVQAFFRHTGMAERPFRNLRSPQGRKHGRSRNLANFLLMEATRLADEQAQEDIDTDISQETAEPVDKLKVLIVDDSPIMSKILYSMMAADPTIEVVGTAKKW